MVYLHTFVTLYILSWMLTLVHCELKERLNKVNLITEGRNVYNDTRPDKRTFMQIGTCITVLILIGLILIYLFLTNLDFSILSSLLFYTRLLLSFLLTPFLHWLTLFPLPKRTSLSLSHFFFSNSTNSDKNTCSSLHALNFLWLKTAGFCISWLVYYGRLLRRIYDSNATYRFDCRL